MDSADTKATLDATLRAFGATAGGIELGLDEQGVCLLVFNSTRQVYIVADPSRGEAVVWSPVGPLPGHEAAVWLLRANLSGIETRGGTLALAPTEDLVVLTRRCPVSGLDADSLAILIEDIVECAEHFAIRLADQGGGSAAASTPADGDVPGYASAIRG